MTRTFLRFPRTRLVAVALAAVLPLALAGCAEDGEPSSEPAPSVEPSTSQPPTSSTPSEAPSDEQSSPTDDGGSPSEDGGGGDSGGGGGTTFSYDDAVALVDGAGGSPRSQEKFQTQGGVVYCLLDGRFVPPACELLDGAIEDPQICAGAPTDFVGRIELSDAGAAPQCNTDTIRGAPAPTLAEGDVVESSRSGVRCAVLAAGVVCIDPASETGFELTRGAYRITVG